MTESLDLFLVEDEEDIAYLMRKALERAGHRVTVCRTGADALIVLANTSFQLVVLDHYLPDMEGLELLQNLSSEGIDTPVLMVTMYGDENLATQVLRAGALDYLVKDQALTFLSELPKRVYESVSRHRLQQMNRLLIESFESASDGVLITDLQGTIQHVNRALERMFGFDRQDLLGGSPRLFKSGVHPPEMYADMWRSILARNSWKGELVNKRKDGSHADTSLTISPILDSRGKLTHFVGIFRDISERKRMERQLFQAQKMQSVGTLAGGVAHEFNNLLAGIQGYASLGLREPSVVEPLNEFLQNIVDLSERAANLTRQLLAFARKPALSRAPMPMGRLMGTTADFVRQTLSVQVEQEVPTDDPGRYIAAVDANQLQQVLVNLVLNARDAMETPEPITFRVRQQKLSAELPSFPQSVPAGDYVVLEVEDHGSGMSAEVLSQAFDPFFTTKEVGQGTGLGLAVAFGIVHGHQGFLTVESEVGKGTKVCIHLPRLGDEEQESTVERFDSGHILEPEQVPARRILVIDDEQAVVDVVRRFLNIAGHEVHATPTGQQGLDVLGKESFDLIILDLMIPNEDGATNFQQLRGLAPHLPILLCTGLLQADQTSHLLDEPSVDLIRKPFRMNELWYAVNRCLPPE